MEVTRKKNNNKKSTKIRMILKTNELIATLR